MVIQLQAQEKVSNIPGLLDKHTDDSAVPLEVKQIKVSNVYHSKRIKLRCGISILSV